MKKFIFSLQVLEQYKLNLEKEQKIILAEILQKIKVLEEEWQGVLLAIERTNHSLNQALKNSNDLVNDLRSHNLYLRYLEDAKLIAEQKIARAEAEKHKIQEQLIAVMKELKSLASLKEKEYQAYLLELKQEEEKIIGDLVAHKAASTRV